jgi:hypothetical protein
MTIFQALAILYATCLTVTAVIGWRYGGRSERWGVAIIVVASLLTVIVTNSAMFQWRTHRTPLIVVDAVMLIPLVVLALVSSRFWPIWAAAFHLIALCSHGAVSILPRGVVQAYAIFQGFWAYPIMACILIGAWSHHRTMTPHPLS